MYGNFSPPLSHPSQCTQCLIDVRRTCDYSQIKTTTYYPPTFKENYLFHLLHCSFQLQQNNNRQNNLLQASFFMLWFFNICIATKHFTTCSQFLSVQKPTALKKKSYMSSQCSISLPQLRCAVQVVEQLIWSVGGHDGDVGDLVGSSAA